MSFLGGKEGMDNQGRWNAEDESVFPAAVPMCQRDSGALLQE